MKPYLRGTTWWARIPRPGAIAAPRSLGVQGKQNKDVALDVCRFLAWLKGRRETWLLDQFARGSVAIGAAYTAYLEHRLPSFITEARDGVTNVDLEPFVAKWQQELARRKKPNAEGRAKYLRQVRTLIPAGQPFRRSEFTRARVMAWLQTLEVGATNRYRAALSSFAEYLLDHDVLATNPVRQVKMARESSPRTLHLSVADATALVGVIDAPYDVLHALMLSTGMEVSAALAVKRRDVDLDGLAVYARGTKTATRERTCYVTATWEPVFARVANHAKHLTPDAPLFPGLDVWGALAALRRALAAKGLPREYRTHDHRHTWAVAALRDGIEAHAVAAQLGHSNAVMLRTVYGKYVPNRADFRRNDTADRTTPLTRGVK